MSLSTFMKSDRVLPQVDDPQDEMFRRGYNPWGESKDAATLEAAFNVRLTQNLDEAAEEYHDLVKKRDGADPWNFAGADQKTEPLTELEAWKVHKYEEQTNRTGAVVGGGYGEGSNEPQMDKSSAQIAREAKGPQLADATNRLDRKAGKTAFKRPLGAQL